MPRKGFRAAHCKNGHARTPDNVNAKGYCIVCSRKYYKQWRDNHKREGRVAARKWKYGITDDQYQALLVKQDNRCAICKCAFDPSCKKTSPHVYHSHTYYIVRGVLCDWCNKGLGNFGDSIEVLQVAIEYLNKTGGE